jgi:hypothetical protein
MCTVRNEELPHVSPSLWTLPITEERHHLDCVSDRQLSIAMLQKARQLSDTVQAPSHAGAAAAVFALHCLQELQAAPQGGAAAGGGPRVRAYLPLPALRAAVKLLAELRRDGPAAAERGAQQHLACIGRMWC